MIRFFLDDAALDALPGETILEAAQRHGVDIPRLCHADGLRPDGNCRACVVEVEGERVLAASCCRAPRPEMRVHSSSARARASQKLVVELLLSDAGAARPLPGSELHDWAARLGVGAPRFPMRDGRAAFERPQDATHPAISVDLDACIQCGRCVRACREEQVNDVIGLAYRGEQAKIVFDLDDPMGVSTCVACGECVQACPTGALAPATLAERTTQARQGRVALPVGAAVEQVDSVCPYCGVGCQLTYNVVADAPAGSPDSAPAMTDAGAPATARRILWVDGRDGPANHGRLCVKGRYGFDYVTSPRRLAQPLVRRAGVPKDPADIDRAARGELDPFSLFREATWEEALERSAGGLARLRDEALAQAGDRPGAPPGLPPDVPLAGFGSAKGSNEEAYLFQKLVRTGFRTNNVDHCTRLCHASSVAALLEGVGSGAVSNPVADVEHAEVVLVIGANPTVNHPVAATWIKNAVKRGTKLIVADPRRSDLGRHATHYLQFRPSTDVALLNALLHVIVHEGLVDESFIARRTQGFEALAARVADYAPERIAPIVGIDATTIREVARLYATARASMILWGMGISQHVHGTDNARCLIALAMLSGQIGRPGTGLHPLRGQNNVQGASDAGLIPMMLPDYRRVAAADVLPWFEAMWASPLDPRPGLTVVEIMHAIDEGRVRGMYIVGENPAMSDPDLAHARASLARLDHLVVQDIFLTETAVLADVVLPASAHAEKVGSYTNTDRLVQIGRAALDPPGDARQDLWAIEQIGRRMGLPWRYWPDGASSRPGWRADSDAVGRVYEEMRSTMPSIAGISWARLNRDGAAVYPCADEDAAGQPVVFVDRFPTATGRATLVAADWTPADELPDAQWPFVLITGRQLEHWHTGTMTREAAVLDAIEPAATVLLHPDDARALGVAPGDPVRVTSRRGTIECDARVSEAVARGNVFLPFAYREAAANLLTNAALDPVAKIPEFKFCAVRVEALTG